MFCAYLRQASGGIRVYAIASCQEVILYSDNFFSKLLSDIPDVELTVKVVEICCMKVCSLYDRRGPPCARVRDGTNAVATLQKLEGEAP
jgi:hypothetical protein